MIKNISSGRAILYAVLSSVVLLTTAINEAKATPDYTVIDLGTLSGPEGGNCWAFGVSSNGLATGYSSNNIGDTHAFSFNQTISDLGLLPGHSTSIGYGINAAGKVAGFSGYSEGGFSYHRAVIFQDGAVTNLGTLPGGATSEARAVNDIGQVVGFSTTEGTGTGPYNGPAHAFLSDAGKMTDLGTLGGTNSYAFDINNAGQIVGESWTADGGSVGFLYNGSFMTSLGLPASAYYSSAFGISESGLIAGYVYWPDGYRPALYKNGKWIDLGTLGGQNGQALAVNDSGQAVGWSDTANNQHAFLYTDGQMIDLNSLLISKGWSNVYVAYDINNKGQVIGTGLRNGGVHSFLLTPVKPVDTAAPTLTATATPAFLWPPNGQRVKVTVSGTISDADSGVNLRSAQYSVIDEYAQVQPAGKITVKSDGTYAFTIQLPAKRNSKDKDGRVYQVVLQASDVAGNTASTRISVTVPVTQPKATPVMR